MLISSFLFCLSGVLQYVIPVNVAALILARKESKCTASANAESKRFNASELKTKKWIVMMNVSKFKKR